MTFLLVHCTQGLFMRSQYVTCMYRAISDFRYVLVATQPSIHNTDLKDMLQMSPPRCPSMHLQHAQTIMNCSRMHQHRLGGLHHRHAVICVPVVEHHRHSPAILSRWGTSTCALPIASSLQCHSIGQSQGICHQQYQQGSRRITCLASASSSSKITPSKVPVTLISGISSGSKLLAIKQILSGAKNHASMGILLSSPIEQFVSDTEDLVGSVIHHPDGLFSSQLINGLLFGNLDNQDDVAAIAKHIQQGKLQHLLIEDYPTSSPLITATEFDSLYEQLAPETFIGGLITVVKAERFIADVLSSTSLQDLGLVDTPDEGEEVVTMDDRTVADVLVEQVEYANTLLVNYQRSMEQPGTPGDACDSNPQVDSLLRALNRTATIMALDSLTSIGPDKLLSTGAADIEGLQQTAPGWAAELAQLEPAANTSAATRHAAVNAAVDRVTTWVYTAQRPFHPSRLMSIALTKTWQGVVRSKGYCWLATRHDRSGLWQSAGGAWQCEPAGLWAASVPAAERPGGIDTSTWHPVWGDRETQIVWIGVNMQEKELRGMLDACLLSDEELALGPAAWLSFEDPLPGWEYQEDDHGHDHDELADS